MKKFIVVIIAVIAASAFKFGKAPCENQPQYYFNGTSYQPAGNNGEDYICNQGVGTCTYYRPDPINNPYYYLPCIYGIHERF